MKRGKEIGKEHHKYKDNGELAGVYSIDAEAAKKVGKDRWDRIDQVINAYATLHPAEMQGIIVQNQMTRLNHTQAGNATGKSTEGSMRWGVSMPPVLLMKIEAVHPEVFSDKKVFHQFMKRYKGLTVAQTV